MGNKKTLELREMINGGTGVEPCVLSKQLEHRKACDPDQQQPIECGEKKC